MVSAVTKTTFIKLRFANLDIKPWLICNSDNTNGDTLNGERYQNLPFSFRSTAIGSRAAIGNPAYILTLPVRSAVSNSRFVTDAFFEDLSIASCMRTTHVSVILVTRPIDEGYFAYSEDLGIFTVRKVTISANIQLKMQNAFDASSAKIPTRYLQNFLAV